MTILNKEFVPRRYQESILATAAHHNSLVVLPTGTGKTAIAAMLSSLRLKHYPQSKIVFLAPTKPLAQQHLETFKEFFDLPEQSFALFTGHVRPEKRQELWKEASFIFSTPQGLENDVISRRLSLKDVSLIIFDEAHRASGDYAYVYLAENYHTESSHERILALTASPGSDEAKIREVCDNLFIDEIEVRSQDDYDMKEYVQEMDIRWQEVILPDAIEAIRYQLNKSYESKLVEATTLGVLKGKPENYNKGTLLKLQAALMAQTAQGEKTFEVLKTVSLIAEALKVQHALELCETQTVRALEAYLSGLVKQSATSKTKAVKNLVKDISFKTAHILARRLLEKDIEHPKIAALKDLITKERMEKKNPKIIIFTQYRDTASTISERLSDICLSKIFVGQAKKGTTGLSQKKQKEMIEEFRSDEFPVLIATSVAEEGLDIPAVDHVIFYEPVPSAIRTVQRRGRTGRQSAGKVTVLMAKNTRDEGYRWSAHHKEKRMYRNLKSIKKNFRPGDKKDDNPQRSIEEFGRETICVDYREKGSAVMKSLLSKGAALDLQQLKVGDYVVGDVVVEYKHVKDFVDSIVDGRLLSQLRELRGTANPLIIIEGKEDLYAQRQINPASINGMLASILTAYKIPVIRTMTAHETAGILLSIAQRAGKKNSSFQAHFSKPQTLAEQQEYVVASLPDIGTNLAQELLKHFGSVSAVLNASVGQLQEVALIGKKKAEKIRLVLDEKYLNLQNSSQKP